MWKEPRELLEEAPVKMPSGRAGEGPVSNACHPLVFTNLSDLLWLTEHVRCEHAWLLRSRLGQARGQGGSCYLRLSLDACLWGSLEGKKKFVTVKVRIKSHLILVIWGSYLE